MPKGKYEVVVDGQLIGTWSEKYLSRRINIASATSSAWHPGGPWAIQANQLYYLTEARNRLGIAQFHRNLFLEEGPLHTAPTAEFFKAHEALERLQREAARPVPYRFVIRPAKGRE